MAKLEREPKDPVRKGRAELVKAVTGEDWQGRTGAKLEKQGRDGLKLVVAKAPDYILDGDGEIVGVDAWVQLFDERGRELPIDPHRRIINPPTAPRSGVRLVDTGKVDQRGQAVMGRVVTADPAAAFWEAVWDSVEGVPNEKGWRTRGTVTTTFGDVGGGYCLATSATYSTSRAMTGASVGTHPTNDFTGQELAGATYYCYEAFESFDSSSIADSDVVSAVSLDVWLTLDATSTDFTIEARTQNWGATLEAADSVTGASLGGLTLLASLSTSGIGATGAYKTFTSDAAFLSATNLKTGTVYVMLSSSRHRGNNAPSGQEVIGFAKASTAGTTQDPKLTITHASAGSAPFFTSRPNRIWRLG